MYFPLSFQNPILISRIHIFRLVFYLLSPLCSEEDREPWIKAADIEKARHEQRWPGYRYNPVQTNPTQLKRTLSNNNNTPPNGARVQSSVAGPSRMENSPSERLGRSLARPQNAHRVFKQPELPVSYSTAQGSVNSQYSLHAPLPRMASVRPAATAINVENDIHNSRHLESLNMHIQFTDPFQINEDPTSAIDTYNSIPTPPSAYSFEGSLPPESPAVISAPTNFLRIVPRRSSSCPPLPPPGAIGLTTFHSSPVALQSPFVNSQYAIPNPLIDMDSTGLFRNPFPSNSLFASVPPLASANTPHIPSTSNHHSLFSDDYPRSSGSNVPDSIALLPQQRHIQAHLDTNSRLMHRRGSSLDRALASSTLAGVFGGFSRNSQHWINPWTELPQLLQSNPVIQRSQPIVLPETQLVTNTVSAFLYHFSLSSHLETRTLQNEYNPIRGLDTSLSPSGTETPGLSPSPPSSVENVDAHQSSQSTQEETYKVPTKETYCSTPTSKAVAALSQSPSVEEIFKFPSDRKVSGRLFGSQGARLGLDLDLETSPLSLDVSFKEGRSFMDSHFVMQHMNHSTTSSTGPDSPSFPYTPASASGLSPSVFTYSYTQALLDPETEMSTQEFHMNSK